MLNDVVTSAEDQLRATPLRGREVPVQDGCRMLRDRSSSYADGAESRLYEIIQSATDLSSTSDELPDRATNWPELYHLSRDRANCLRPFSLSPAFRVLEVGAGCGAITRYLGENCLAVDSLEPATARARVARSRTRDLDNVEVFVGQVEDVPAEPIYDAVAVIGVLEYVGGGVRNLSRETSFLTHIRKLLKPEGLLILAIENRIGVKYMVGAPEDHTGKAYDSVEGYPRGGHARTFTRTELSHLLTTVGFSPTFYSAFPDYKLTRVLMPDQLFTVAPWLASAIPVFPSPDWVVKRPRGANESRVWRSLCADGIGPNFANSFVVTATRDRAAHTVWPADQLAVYYNTDRRSPYATERVITANPRSVGIGARDLTEPSLPESQVQLGREDDGALEGQALLDVLEASDDQGITHELSAWLGAVARRSSEGFAQSDFVPMNLIRTPGGALVQYDGEGGPSKMTQDELIARGLLLTGIELAKRHTPQRWKGATTVRDVVQHIAQLAAVTLDDAWLGAAVGREAELQGAILRSSGGAVATQANIARRRRLLEQTLDSSLETGELGPREHELRRRAEKELEKARTDRATRDNEVQTLQNRINELSERLDQAERLDRDDGPDQDVRLDLNDELAQEEPSDRQTQLAQLAAPKRSWIRRLMRQR